MAGLDAPVVDPVEWHADKSDGKLFNFAKRKVQTAFPDLLFSLQYQRMRVQLFDLKEKT